MRLRHPVFSPLIWAVLAGVLAGCRSTQPIESLPDVDRATAWMSGSFSSSAQAAADPAYREVTLHIVPIWVGRTDIRGDERWLYVEQAMASSPGDPYRQRVYRVGPGPNGTVRSDIYTLPDPPIEYAGAWKFAQPLDDLTPSDLFPREGCTVFLVAEGTSRFVGSTDGTGCESTLRGAAYATSQVLLTADRLESWDQGFDAEGKQVWGATKGAYEFVRTDPQPSGG